MILETLGFLFRRFIISLDNVSYGPCDLWPRILVLGGQLLLKAQIIYINFVCMLFTSISPVKP